jgi:hypothetical protein
MLDSFHGIKRRLLVRVQSITELLQVLAKFGTNRLLRNMQKQLQLQRRIQGSLRCAAHDTTVSSFGRDDVSFGLLGGGTTTTADPCGMTNKRTDKGNDNSSGND